MTYCPDRAIRDATPADAEALHGLIERAYRGDSARLGWTSEADLLGGQRTDPEEIDDILADPDRALLAAFDGEALVGCVLIAGEGEGVGYFGMLSVEPTLQSAGVGSRLIAAAETALAERFGARVVRLRVFPQRHSLIAWYERLGYRATGETAAFPYGNARLGLPLRDDLHFVILEKRLPPPP